MRTDHSFRSFITGETMLRIVIGYFISITLARLVQKLDILERFKGFDVKKIKPNEVFKFVVQFLVGMLFIYFLYRTIILSRPKEKTNNSKKKDNFPYIVTN
tara:strand:- start:714 stop:1016 length:303 start_codon:yes stop_codon:yes gene_type:complete